jgi:hypothetical protein
VLTVFVTDYFRSTATKYAVLSQRLHRRRLFRVSPTKLSKNNALKGQREQARLQLALRAEPILPATGVNNIQPSREVNGHGEDFFTGIEPRSEVPCLMVVG